MLNSIDKVANIPRSYISKIRNFAGKEIDRARREENRLEECYQQGIWKVLSDILEDYYIEESGEE